MRAEWYAEKRQKVFLITLGRPFSKWSKWIWRVSAIHLEQCVGHDFRKFQIDFNLMWFAIACNLVRRTGASRRNLGQHRFIRGDRKRAMRASFQLFRFQFETFLHLFRQGEGVEMCCLSDGHVQSLWLSSQQVCVCLCWFSGTHA